MKQFIASCCMAFGWACAAQTCNPNEAIKLFSENDFWYFGSKTDIYYTQGLKIQYLNSIRSTSRFNGWWPLKVTCDTLDTTIGVSIGQNIYTSSDIEVPELMPEDRPYAGWLYAGISVISNSATKKRRLTTDVYLGVIGPSALGEFVQKNWHELIDSPEPLGWHHEIRNDVGVNLAMRYEMDVLNLRPLTSWLALDAIPNAEAQAGTVFNNVSAGATVRLLLGRYVPYFESSLSATGGIIKGKDPKSSRSACCPFFKEFNAGLMARPSGRMVLYNATLQGGVFNRDSEYTVAEGDIERFYFDVDYGITFSTTYLEVSYFRAYRTKEFDYQAKNHTWGQLYITVKF